MQKKICEAVDVLVEALHTIGSEQDLGCARLTLTQGCLIIRSGQIQIVVRDVGKRPGQVEKGPFVEWRWTNGIE